jgi:hypothetical protein
MTPRKRVLPGALLLVVLISAAASPVEAGDKSFSTVVKHIKNNYNAKQQGFFGAMMLARFAVKIVRPAGVKNFKVVWLKNLEFQEGRRDDFQAATRQLIGKEWEPLVQYNSRVNGQFNHVYVQQEKKDVKLLVVALQKNEAFIVQTKFSPEKLIKFIDDPKILGISLKDKTNGTPQNQNPDPQPPDTGEEGKEEKKSEKKAGENSNASVHCGYQF